MNDPQDEVDVPQKWIDKADLMAQDRILTSVDEEAYANGDWTDAIYEHAAEMWAQDEEDRKCAKADRQRDEAKDAT